MKRIFDLSQNNLPYITDDLPGIGGKLKSTPKHFIVEEIPLYEASGEGEHLYVSFVREGMTTRFLHKKLASILDISEKDIGYAGLKDRHARTTQTFSFRMPEDKDIKKCMEEHLDVEVKWIKRHKNKIKRGHLLGNRFQIIVTEVEDDCLEKAQAIAAALREIGIPNYYGEQRFGKNQDNAHKGLRILQGKGRFKPWIKRFLLSSYQAELFNRWLIARIKRGNFRNIFQGDIAKKVDTGGIFTIEDIEEGKSRFQKGEITYTGPIYGHRMLWAEFQPGEWEREILEQEKITEENFRKVKLRGSRRRAIIEIEKLEITPVKMGICFEFSLPKGSYATIVLQEFMKTSLDMETNYDKV